MWRASGARNHTAPTHGCAVGYPAVAPTALGSWCIDHNMSGMASHPGPGNGRVLTHTHTLKAYSDCQVVCSHRLARSPSLTSSFTISSNAASTLADCKL